MKNIKRFASLAGKLRLGVIVFMVITGLVLCCGVLILILSLTRSDILLNNEGALSASLQFNMLRFNISESLISAESIQDFFIFISVYGILYAVITLYMEKQILNVLKWVKKEQPFNVRCIKSIKVLGFTIIGNSIVFEAINNLHISKIYKMFELGKAEILSPLFKMSIEGISFSIPVDLTILGVGIIVLLLSYVFEYGAYLQSEYDSIL